MAVCGGHAGTIQGTRGARYCSCRLDDGDTRVAPRHALPVRQLLACRLRVPRAAAASPAVTRPDVFDRFFFFIIFDSGRLGQPRVFFDPLMKISSPPVGRKV